MQYIFYFAVYPHILLLHKESWATAH